MRCTWYFTRDTVLCIAAFPVLENKTTPLFRDSCTAIPFCLLPSGNSCILPPKVRMQLFITEVRRGLYNFVGECQSQLPQYWYKMYVRWNGWFAETILAYVLLPAHNNAHANTPPEAQIASHLPPPPTTTTLQIIIRWSKHTSSCNTTHFPFRKVYY